MKEEKKSGHNEIYSAKIIPVILTEVIIGEGAMGDPVRTVLKYWTIDGSPIVTIDPIFPSKTHLL